MPEIAADLAGGYDELVEVGYGVGVAFYPDGSIGIRHECTRPRDGQTIIVAPRLQLDAGHTLLARDPVTITPSVGCSDCGLHGFVTGGVWQPAGRLATDG